MSETATNNIDSSTSSPGAILKRCREYHGITLEEAAEATKVGANYLKALETDQTKEFASLAYLKGFLRIYASYLGLNPDDIMRLYEKMSSPDDSRGGVNSAGEEKRDNVRRRFSWKKLVLPACLLLLLIMTAAIINRPKKASLQQAAPQPAMVAQAPQSVLPPLSSARKAPPAPKSEPVITPKDFVRQEPATSDRNSALTQLQNLPKGFVVRMKATQNGIIVVTIDGAKAQSYDLATGDVIEWKSEKNITLDIPNAGGVEAELNGKPLGSFGPAGKPAYVVLDADGIKQ